jgi:hypothetical protein
MKTKATLFVAVVTLSFIFSSCEKAEQFIQKAVLTEIITNDRWLVEAFAVSGTDVTTEYAPYQFEFNTNGTLTAIKATETIVGEWKEDLNALSIHTNFKNPTPTLERFNNVWYINKTSATYVEAKAITATGVFTLKLVKKQ